MSMATKRRLIIHAGQHKTGSTSIQNALFRPDLEVAGQSWRYATLPRTQDHHALYRMIEHGYGKSNPFARAGVAGMRAWIAGQRGDTVILSAESFSELPPRHLARALAPLMRRFDETRVLLYVRPHLGAFTSLFVEHVKMGTLFCGLEKYAELEGDRFEYAGKLARWRDAFGDRLTVRPFIRDRLSGGSVIEDFLAQAFPDTTARHHGAPEKNVALGMHDLMRLKVFHRTLARHGIGARHHLGWPLADLISPGAPRDTVKLQLHHGLADTLATRYAPDAARVDREVFDGEPVFSDALARERARAVDTPLSLRPGEWIAADEINTLKALATVFAQSHGKSPMWRLRLHLRHLERQSENNA
ncbi:hypothetical protein GQE99_08405 [Maritimibacter sp. DP07]|uniref:Sulfotransferase family protein n=1 Tax=Maritimibacter harenae TaxID=2606218 RepID=A0A845LYF8_9RHOB|nr:hypothetical protein [Maritimibacter harenae]MZR13040.1 hypothetical protein [Maritimibacter harenae]